VMTLNCVNTSLSSLKMLLNGRRQTFAIVNCNVYCIKLKTPLQYNHRFFVGLLLFLLFFDCFHLLEQRFHVSEQRLRLLLRLERKLLRRDVARRRCAQKRLEIGEIELDVDQRCRIAANRRQQRLRRPHRAGKLAIFGGDGARQRRNQLFQLTNIGAKLCNSIVTRSEILRFAINRRSTFRKLNKQKKANVTNHLNSKILTKNVSIVIVR
jgi:hypothetical protein